jgi:hypothetical protein
MMHEHGKSASAIVATKPTNNAGRPAAEPVERRAGTKRNADQQSTRRAQDRESVSHHPGPSGRRCLRNHQDMNDRYPALAGGARLTCQPSGVDKNQMKTCFNFGTLTVQWVDTTIFTVARGGN